MVYGFSLTEKIYKVFKGKILLKKLTYIPQDSVYFDMDDFGNITAVQQYSNLSTSKGLNKSKFILQ